VRPLTYSEAETLCQNKSFYASQDAYERDVERYMMEFIVTSCTDCGGDVFTSRLAPSTIHSTPRACIHSVAKRLGLKP
jgi:hypothetical protein